MIVPFFSGYLHFWLSVWSDIDQRIPYTMNDGHKCGSNPSSSSSYEYPQEHTGTQNATTPCNNHDKMEHLVETFYMVNLCLIDPLYSPQ